MIVRATGERHALIALDVGEEPVHFKNPHLPIPAHEYGAAFDGRRGVDRRTVPSRAWKRLPSAMMNIVVLSGDWRISLRLRFKMLASTKENQTLCCAPAAALDCCRRCRSR